MDFKLKVLCLHRDLAVHGWGIVVGIGFLGA